MMTRIKKKSTLSVDPSSLYFNYQKNHQNNNKKLEKKEEKDKMKDKGKDNGKEEGKEGGKEEILFLDCEANSFSLILFWLRSGQLPIGLTEKEIQSLSISASYLNIISLITHPSALPFPPSLPLFLPLPLFFPSSSLPSTSFSSSFFFDQISKFEKKNFTEKRRAKNISKCLPLNNNNNNDNNNNNNNNNDDDGKEKKKLIFLLLLLFLIWFLNYLTKITMKMKMIILMIII